MLIFLFLLAVLCTFFFVYVNGVRFDYCNVNFWLGVFSISFLGGGGIALGLFDWSYFVAPLSNDLRINVFAILVFCSVLYFLLFFIFSGTSRSVWNKYLNKAVVYGFSEKIALLMFVTICLFSSAVYLYQSHPSILIYMLRGENSLDIALRRQQLGVGYSDVGITYAKTMAILFSQVSFLSIFSLYLLRKVGLVGLTAAATFCFLILSVDGQKAPFITLVICCFCLITYLDIKIRFLKSAIFISVFSLVFLVAYTFLMGVDIGDVAHKLIERVFVAQVIAVFGAYELYPSIHPHIGFDSLNMPFHEATRDVAASELLSFFYNEMRDWGAWNVNGLYLHEAWANWGWHGIAFATIFAAFLNGAFLRIMLSIKKDPLILGFFSFLSGNLLYFLTGFNGFIYNLQYPALLIAVVACVISGKFARKFKRQ